MQMKILVVSSLAMRNGYVFEIVYIYIYIYGLIRPNILQLFT